MSMVTRCPACGTLFRVSAQQLQVRHGKVRCGRCATVFDGFRDLATLPEQRALDEATRGGVVGVAEDPRAPAHRAPPSEVLWPFPAPPAAPITPPVPPGFRFEPTPAPTPAEAARHGLTTAPAPLKPETRIDQGVRSSQPLSADALFLQQAHAARRSGGRGWTLGSALLVVTLAAQATYVYRGDLAAHYRPLKPLLQGMCHALDCDVPLPQRPKQINIEASDLQSLDAARPGIIELTATLRNHADYDLAYPALDLVLTNTREHTLARRVFLPREYLDASRDVHAGIPAKAEITLRLDLDTGDLGAAGFRLDLLPAPTR